MAQESMRGHKPDTEVYLAALRDEKLHAWRVSQCSGATAPHALPGQEHN
ncbi:MAG: hypothetical protein ACRDOV_01040 [Streptomyces sp.]